MTEADSTKPGIKHRQTAILIRILERYGFLAIVLIHARDLAGGPLIDLTAGVGVSISAITMEAVFRSSGNIALALVFSFGIVFLLGLTNGLLVSLLKIESVIVTLIMMTVVQSLVFILTKLGNTINLSNPFYNVISRGTVFGVPNMVIIMVIVYLASYTVLNHTKLGFYLVAIGNNPEGARLAGINLSRYMLFPFLISGFFMGLVAMLLAARILYVTPNIGGTPLLLDAIAAAIIGGVAVGGGKGTVQGVFIGSLAIALINNSINLMDIHPSWNQFFKGLTILIMMLANKYLEMLEIRSKLRDRL